MKKKFSTSKAYIIPIILTLIVIFALVLKTIEGHLKNAEAVLPNRSSILYLINQTDSAGNSYAEIFLDTIGNAVSAVDVKIVYDAQKIEIQNIEKNPDSAFKHYPALMFDNQKGTAYVGANVGTSDQDVVVHSSSAIARINYKNISRGEAGRLKIVFRKGEKNDSNVVFVDYKNHKAVDILTGVINSTDSGVMHKPKLPAKKQTLFTQFLRRIGL